MMLENTSFERAAGYAAVAAMVSLLLAGVTIALFFGGAGGQFGPMNDVFTALTLALLALPVLAIRRQVADTAGPVFGLISLLALIGLAIAAAGQLLLVVGAIPLEASFVTGGIGILPVFVWAVALVVVSLQSNALPDVLGWTTVAVLALSASTALVAAVSSGTVVSVVSGVLFLALEAWLASLAWTLLARA